MGERNTDPAMCRAFVREVNAALASTPQVRYELSIDADEDHCILDIPKAADDGFDITVEVEPDDITIITEAAHFHADLGATPEETVEYALGLLLGLLSGDMRIRESLAGGEPYKWQLQALRNGEWVTKHTGCLLFWRFFGKRTERIYQNRVL